MEKVPPYPGHVYKKQFNIANPFLEIKSSRLDKVIVVKFIRASCYGVVCSNLVYVGPYFHSIGFQETSSYLREFFPLHYASTFLCSQLGKTSIPACSLSVAAFRTSP